MDIPGMEDLSREELSDEVMRGGRFVFYEYCISLLIITFKRGTGVHYIPPGKGAVTPGLFYTIITIILGWWGFPWGPIYTIQALVTNFGGGKDVTMDVMNALDGKPSHTTLV